MISVVAIAKNEIKNLLPFVNSWSEVADEIIIVDTGSKDGTYEALLELEKKRSKLRVFRFDWINDFSAARNFASSKALGTWILWADLDDRINIPSVPRIRELSRSRGYAYAFQVASDVGRGNWHRFIQIRMYPNEPSLKFHGKIHENLELSLKLTETEVLRDETVMIAHLGYADENTRKQKAIRNLDLLLQDGPPTTADRLAQVGDALYAIGKYKVGLGYYEEAVRVSGSDVKKILAEKLIVGYLCWGAFEKAYELIHECLDVFTVSREYWTAEYWRLRGGFDSTAKMHYERCLGGARELESRECNADTMIYDAKQFLMATGGNLCVTA